MANDPTPAQIAAEETRKQLFECLDQRKSFRLEAGAGAGKTYSLIEALKHLIAVRGQELIRSRRKVACITYTKVARDEIESRTDRHPAIASATIHSFCWSAISDFQSFMRTQLPSLKGWAERIAEAGDVPITSVEYDLGHPRIEAGHAQLGHNDVLSLTTKLLVFPKFRCRLQSSFPIIFIDEYQDTDKELAEAIKEHLLNDATSPVIGLFGDHWQKIYPQGCGLVEHSSLQVISKKSNFRSASAIVEGLNKMRPSLPQQVNDIHVVGNVTVFHSNDWIGARRTSGQWAGDLPEDIAVRYLKALTTTLQKEGWVFSGEQSKILMLTHKVLAAQQGYVNLADAFKYNEAFAKKEDYYIKFFVDTVEPACIAFKEKRYAAMFEVMGTSSASIRSTSDKQKWHDHMTKLVELREGGTVDDVLRHLRQDDFHGPRIPSDVERREAKFNAVKDAPTEDDQDFVSQTLAVKALPYREVIRVAEFIDEKTPFATKHGVKGAEFENVVVIFGRGWANYNFNQFLEWAVNPDTVPADKRDTYERNRNLFYVVCSRPKKRLSLLFTQKLSQTALSTLGDWFGAASVKPLSVA